MNRNGTENMDEKTMIHLNYQKRKGNYKLIKIFIEDEGEAYESKRTARNVAKKARDPGFIEALIPRKINRNRPDGRKGSPWRGKIGNTIKYLEELNNARAIKHKLARILKYFKQVPLKDVNKFFANEDRLIGMEKPIRRYN